MSKSRFVTNVVATAKADTVALPWTRGKRRAAFIAKRATTEKKAA